MAAKNGQAGANGYRAGIIGLGYVGLPLAMEFARAGITIVGVDIDKRRVDQLRSGQSYIEDVPSELVRAQVDAGRFIPTTDYAELRSARAISICVPTPLGKSKDPDMSPVAGAAEKLVQVLEKGQTVVLESTVYPGATEEFVQPILERSGLKAGQDFFLAFSPERIDPGNKRFTVPEIPKVVGGLNAESTRRAVDHYARVFNKVVEVGSTREAEMAKLLENTFRAVNIGLVNELAVVAHSMGIDIWRVIEAASSKPFGFMPFYPGPGWGGHCIPVDPFYLTWRARMEGYEVGFIDHAGRVNNHMPHYTVDRVAELLNREGKPVKGSKVLILGAAYKRDVSDVRESPALEVMKLLDARGAKVALHDPHVASVTVDDMTWKSVPLTAELLAAQDCAVIVTDHRATDYEFVAKNAKLVFDTRNATAQLRQRYANIAVL
jgi:UDP-N-acetyl-D-glucosamine dehydrogenase